MTEVLPWRSSMIMRSRKRSQLIERISKTFSDTALNRTRGSVGEASSGAETAWCVLDATNDLGDVATVDTCRRIIDANLSGKHAMQSDMKIIVEYFRCPERNPRIKVPRAPFRSARYSAAGSAWEATILSFARRFSGDIGGGVSKLTPAT